MVTRKDYSCPRCSHVLKDIWTEVKQRGHLYCPKCRQNPELTKTEARL